MLPLTSSTLGFLLAMALFPDAQQRAQAELDRVLGGARLPTLTDRPALPYLSALILELYRWAPVAPLSTSCIPPPLSSVSRGGISRGTLADGCVYG